MYNVIILYLIRNLDFVFQAGVPQIDVSILQSSGWSCECEDKNLVETLESQRS